jgi:4-amino-4-deoxy-L-arabinose transferase-like glycosyltransferase
MGRDEARLALAARGILDHGLPILADGFLYTRGLLPAYLNAATFAILGPSDQDARLSDLVFATLLVVAVYRLGRLAGGHRPAMAAAIIVAFSPPMVLQAHEAWLYSSFLLWMALALGWLVRDDPGDRIRAGLAALAALFSHELAVLFVPVALAIDLGRAWTARRRRARSTIRGALAPRPPLPREGEGESTRKSGAAPFSRHGEAAQPRGSVVLDAQGEGLGVRASAWRSVALFWAILLAGTAAVCALSLMLRAPTLGGPTTEIREYLRPAFDLRGLERSLDILGSWHPWLLPVAVLGLPLTRGGWRVLLAGRGAMPCLLMLLAILAFNSFGLVRRGEPRYMLAAIPFLTVVAAVSLDRAGPSIVAALIGRRRLGRARHITRFVLLTLLVFASLDPARLIADARSRNVSDTWVQALDGREPTDLIVSFAPTLTTHYLGKTDFWLRTGGYAKYVWVGRPPLRDVHTGATVIRSQGELERLLLVPYRGQTAWVVLAGEPSDEHARVMRSLAERLEALAVETRRSADGRIVLKLQL